MFNNTKHSFLRRVLAFVILSLAAWPALAAEPCRTVSDADRRFSVCTFDLRDTPLRLFWRGADGKPYENFSAVVAALKPQGEALTFAMNAGMFQPDFSPVGLYVEDGRQFKPANVRAGPGNFHLKPNGVFYFGTRGAGIMETSRFLKAGIKPDFATQSGPMLVLDGALHPKIEPTGTSEKIRNGVGVRDGHIAVFAISEEPVNFYRFASLFRDKLGCRDALYLDGSISSLYAPSLDRADHWLPIGPIVGAIEKVAR